MSVYIAPHLKQNSNLKETKQPFTESTDNLKIKTNSPYGKLDSLESLKAASPLGFTVPTVIQKYAIPVVLNNHPLLCRAPTGLGKTLCFLLPLIESMKFPHGLKICILAPTRELCAQTGDVAKSIAKKLTVECAYGGSRRNSDANILVACPGRLLDLLNSGAVNFAYLTNFVLDEADKLLDMGFEREIRSIKAFIPQTATVSLFSATYHKNLETIINEFLPPNRVFIEVQNETVQNIKQVFYEVRNKDEKLKDLLTGEKTIVFVQMKTTAQALESKIRIWGYKVVSLHGDKLQPERQHALGMFRRGEATIMVATSVAARGIDINDVGTVINYDFPNDIKDYIHRIGRTGRQGRDGLAISLISEDLAGEMRNDLVEVLKESKNEIPEFLNRRGRIHKKRGEMKSENPRREGEIRRESEFRRESDARKELKYVARELKNMTVEEDKEKQNSEDDLPGAW